MIILGIDPGVATIGFAALKFENNRYQLIQCGVINTPAHTPLSERLAVIYNDLTELIEAFRPDVVAIEELFFNTNLTTGISVAHGRGVILLACHNGCRLRASGEKAGNGNGKTSVRFEICPEAGRCV